MKATLQILLVALLLQGSAFGGGRIKYYFNKPVDHSVALYNNATYANHSLADTLVAYINRAQYSLDIALYSFDRYSVADDSTCTGRVANAVNSAYSRGVKVRWIYDGSASNSALSTLNSGINKLGSPTTSAYGIMHNKFVVIDAKATDHNLPIVWTGSTNWYYKQFNYYYNNVVTVQDSALAAAYTAEFNMMWGDTGIAPNSTNSKFGPNKTDLGLHDFYVDGTHIELYFSPSDHTDSHIQTVLNNAHNDISFGVYTFTEHTDADIIVAKHNAGLSVYGINDSYSNTYYPTTTFNTALGSSHFKVYTEDGDTIFHAKFVVVDATDTCSDPTVLTGSHNWTVSADTKNDENTLIIHSADAANQYLQYFKSSFAALGGSMNVPAYSCVPASVNSVQKEAIEWSLYPNPTSGTLNFSSSVGIEAISLLTIEGQEIATFNYAVPLNETQISCAAKGWVIVSITKGGRTLSKMIFVE